MNRRFVLTEEGRGRKEEGRRRRGKGNGQNETHEQEKNGKDGDGNKQEGENLQKKIKKGEEKKKSSTRNPHLSGKFTVTDLTPERPLPSMNPIVHLQGALAAQHSMAHDALVGFPHLVRNAVHHLLQL